MSDRPIIDARDRFAASPEDDRRDDLPVEERLLGFWTSLFALHEPEHLDSVAGLITITDVEQRLVDDYGLSAAEASILNQRACMQAIINSQNPNIAPVVNIKAKQEGE